MRRLTPLLAIAWLAVCPVGCGGTGKAASRVSSSAQAETSTHEANDPPPPVFSRVDADRDNDIGAKFEDKQHPEVTNFGQAANPSDARAIRALIRRYYAVAAVEDGAKACSMLYSPMVEAAPEDQGQSPPGAPYEHGTTCSEVLTKLFTHFRHQLKIESARLKITKVRLEEHHGLALLDFGRGLPLRQISITREGPVWKMAALIDTELA